MVFYEIFSQGPLGRQEVGALVISQLTCSPFTSVGENAFFEVRDVTFLLERRAIVVGKAAALVRCKFGSPHSLIQDFLEFTFETYFTNLKRRVSTATSGVTARKRSSWLENASCRSVETCILFSVL